MILFARCGDACVHQIGTAQTVTTENADLLSLNRERGTGLCLGASVGFYGPQTCMSTQRSPWESRC
eukprot:m.1492595 g.1492595  ORF g.1492595 m.1492595 type:complete len:66 (+) comp25196_c0_seq11:3113-3310(+)